MKTKPATLPVLLAFLLFVVSVFTLGIIWERGRFVWQFKDKAINGETLEQLEEQEKELKEEKEREERRREAIELIKRFGEEKKE
jgi:hypothetical protein